MKDDIPMPSILKGLKEVKHQPSLVEVQAGMDPALAGLDPNPDDYRKTLVATIVGITIHLQNTVPKIRQTWSDKHTKALVTSLLTQPIKVLEDRISAVQVQNPGALIAGMRLAGFKIDVAQDGSIGVDYKPDAGGMGSYVMKEEFEDGL